MILTNNNLSNKELHEIKLEIIKLLEHKNSITLRLFELRKIIKDDNKKKRSIKQRINTRRLVELRREKISNKNIPV